MNERHEDGNGACVPSYLDSLRDTADKEDTRLVDWKEELPRVREFVLGGLQGPRDPGTSIALSSAPRDMLVVVRTQVYGYEARYWGANLPSILEQFENDLACNAVPWQEDYRRRKVNSKRLDV